MGIPCLTLPLYYCTNAQEVVDYAGKHGEVAAMRFWLDQMEFWMNKQPEIFVEREDGRGVQTVRAALRDRSAAMGSFAQSLFPPGVLTSHTPVLYPFSGLDVLTAMSLYPNASTFVLLANLKHGIGLPCFKSVNCVRMASRSSYKIVQNWARHHLAWLETSRMQTLFDHRTGALPTLMLLLHLGGYAFESMHPLAEPQPWPPTSSVQGGADALSSAVRTGPYYAPLLNGTVVKLLNLNGSVVHAASPAGASGGHGGRLRCIFVSVTLRDDESIHTLLQRQRALVSAGVGAREGAPRERPPRYAALLKAAPDELTSQAWFRRWLLGRTVALIQDETGVPIPALLGTEGEGNSTSLATAEDSPAPSASPIGPWNSPRHGHGASAANGSLSTSPATALVRASLASKSVGVFGSTRLEGARWSLGAFGNLTRLQVARNFWNIAELRPRTRADGEAIRGAFTGAELPFAFGYGAYPSECAAAAKKFQRPLGDRGMPCNGILLAAYRQMSPRDAPPGT